MNPENDKIPMWDNSSLYKSINDPEINKALELASVEINKMNDSLADGVTISLAQEMLVKYEELVIEVSSIGSFAHCEFSVDTTNEEAKMLLPKVGDVSSKLNMAIIPVTKFLESADEETINKVLDHELVKDMEFGIRHNREMKDYALSEDQEKVLEGMGQNGIHAWGRLYDTISGSLECELDGKTIPYSQTSKLLRQSDGVKREKAWRAIQKTWSAHEDSIAAILNGINGWRVEENRFRSKNKELHFLDTACHGSHINRKTLDALMETTYENRDIGKRALKAMAKFMGQEKMGPWDIIADAPIEGENSYIDFNTAIDYISEAFSQLNPEMGKFARMMADKNWIDAKPTDTRKPGAYCTRFLKLREPRVYVTYNGGMGNITTLAHEIGHAYHSWVMRDLPVSKIDYAMTTAETASIFGETLVRNYLFDKMESKEDKLKIAWDDAMTASAMICNIPARYEFEKSLVEKRMTQTLSPKDLNSLMKDAWAKWYEDSVSEYDEMFWAHKLHFSISEVSFYNYPYLFGLLFGLGIYSYKDQYGDKFSELYLNVLRDTGSMNAIDLIKKHFNVNIEEKEFWQNSLNILDESVKRFENLIES